MPNVAEIEVKMKLETCKKRARDETSVPVPQIFQEELSELYQKGYDFVAKIPTYSSAKTPLCRERRKALGATQNPHNANDIQFANDTLMLFNGENFLRLDFQNDQDNRILVFGGEESQYLLENGSTFFLDGTVKSGWKQFAQIYTIHVDLRSTETETNVYPALFAFLPDKRQATYIAMFQEVKRWCSKWKPDIIKLDFEAAAINSCMLEFPSSTISGCNFHFNQCLWRKIQEMGLIKEYKRNRTI
ncbi:MULE domain-containing protein [Trichonephila clavata]|uniref:MULE domain-containing protein n=1 Tax=Trichonephila clavata TaxID=2740835 RepID=A0A8X6H1Y8_TRICU|nr:MULE domain-containing protein [Trichonephila clavata]